MRAIAILGIKGQTFSLELKIEGMTSYWAASFSQSIRDCEYVLAMRFQAICCSFWFDANQFFADDKQESLCFSGKIEGEVSRERVKNALESCANYLVKKLGLDLVRVDVTVK